MDYTNPRSMSNTAAQGVAVDQGLRTFLLQVYNYMASALILTGLIAYFGAQSETVMSLMYSQNAETGRIGFSVLGLIITFAPLGLALAMGFGMQKFSAGTMQAMFWAYAVLIGLSFTNIFLLYTGASIARVFFITAIMFGSVSLYGYTTKRDLSGFGKFLFMGLIGIIVASLVNIFLESSALHFAVSVIGVLVFTGLAAYDNQKLKAVYYAGGYVGEGLGKAAIYGALMLYMDFINLFIMLLRLVGDRR